MFISLAWMIPWYSHFPHIFISCLLTMILFVWFGWRLIFPRSNTAKTRFYNIIEELTCFVIGFGKHSFRSLSIFILIFIIWQGQLLYSRACPHAICGNTVCRIICSGLVVCVPWRRTPNQTSLKLLFTWHPLVHSPECTLPVVHRMCPVDIWVSYISM